MEFCLSFYGLIKAAWEDKSRDIAFVFVLIFMMMVGHIKSTSSIFTGC